MARQTGLQFTFQVDGLPDDTFNVLEFSGEEYLSAPFTFVIQLASRNEAIMPVETVEQSGTLTIWRDGKVQQLINGIVSSFSQGDSGYHHTFYEVTLVPSLVRLSLRQNSRMFQQQTVQDIIQLLLQEMGVQDFAFAISKPLATREYCVQYRETDLEFIERIAAEEGLYYYFEHIEGAHKLIFSDDTQKAPALEHPFEYNTLSGGTSSNPFIRSFKQQAQLRPSSVELKDYTFKNPRQQLLNSKIGNELDYQRATYEHYDYPGRYKKDEIGTKFTTSRLEYLRRDALTAHGSSNYPQLRAGYVFSLTDHPTELCNRDWLTTGVSHTGTQPQALEEAGSNGATTYNNSFFVIPAHRQWKPTPNPKPRVDGPQIATVVGPAGEEIFCDEHGRVKVHFPWDRYNVNEDETCSCWIRVSQGWAGGQYGIIAIPRIGHEVIVSFLEGDPDQPIITGRTYHARNQAPYVLPAHKTMTVLRTDTHKGEGFNELRFEDEADKEEIFVHAQKNMDIKVRNSKNERVDYNRTTSIGNNEELVVAKNRTVTIDGKQDHKTTENYTELIEGDKGLTVNGDDSTHVKGARGVKIDGEMTFQSDTKITLKVGGSFVVIHAGGVDIKGGAINLNSGGSAGDLALPVNPAILKSAAGEGSMFVKHCPVEDSCE